MLQVKSDGDEAETSELRSLPASRLRSHQPISARFLSGGYSSGIICSVKQA